MSEIIIQQSITDEQNEEEDSIFTPNPLEFESLAEPQEVTYLFTEFPFEQTTTDSTINFATDVTTDITTDITTVFTADDKFDIKTDETINVTTGVTVGYVTNVTNNVIITKPISSTVPQTLGVTEMLTKTVETIPITVSSSTSIHSTSSVPLISSSTTSSRLSSSSTLQSSLTKSSTATTTTRIQPVTIEVNAWPSTASTSKMKAVMKTSTKYSRKDVCLNFCTDKNSECDFPIENGMKQWQAPYCRCKRGFGHDYTGDCVDCGLLTPNNWESTCKNLSPMAERLEKSLVSKSAKNHLSRIVMFFCIRMNL